jgi:sporulation protein YunB
MIRNSILYHRFWYFKRRNIRRIQVLCRLALIFATLSLLLSYANRMLLPGLTKASEAQARVVVGSVINGAVKEIFSDHAEYEDMVNLHTDKAGRINSIETNVAGLKRLSAEISANINKKLAALNEEKISLPLGSLLGTPVFSTGGPDIIIGLKPVGSVKADFKSEFISEGTNQTRHVIYLHITTNVGVRALMVYREFEMTEALPVAEAVILGSLPAAYAGR